MTHEELITALEEEEAPDRELDAQLWLLCVPGATRKQSSYTHAATGRIRQLDETRRADGRLIVVPKYTASVDAALTLVPEGWALHTLYQYQDGETPTDGWGAALRNYSQPTTGLALGDSYISPAAALCVAVLRARTNDV